MNDEFDFEDELAKADLTDSDQLFKVMSDAVGSLQRQMRDIKTELAAVTNEFLALTAEPMTKVSTATGLPPGIVAVPKELDCGRAEPARQAAAPTPSRQRSPFG